MAMCRPAGWIFQPFGSSVTPFPRLPGHAGGAGARRATVPTAAETKMVQARAMAAKWRLRIGMILSQGRVFLPGGQEQRDGGVG